MVEDATGAIDIVSWADSEGVEAIANAEGETVVIENARLSTDRDGDDVIDVENASVERVTAGIGYIPPADGQANATLSDGGTVEMSQQERIDHATDALAEIEDESGDGADPDDVIDRLTEKGLTEQEAEWALGKLIDDGTVSELPNGRYTVE